MKAADRKARRPQADAQSPEAGWPVPDPARPFRTQETIRGSRFIVTLGYAPTPEAAKRFIEAVRAEFSDATHNCWAWRSGAPGSTAHMGASDDGEPKGTAGRPMLAVLQHCPIGDAAVVVTRYFGGTLLGTGGLVRAYSGMVKRAVDEAPTRMKVAATCITIAFASRHLAEVQRILERAGAASVQKRFLPPSAGPADCLQSPAANAQTARGPGPDMGYESMVEVTAEVPEAQRQQVLAAVRRACAGRVRMDPDPA